MEGRKIYGYARVSSRDQNLDRQIEALVVYGVDERDIVVEKQSGKNFERKQYKFLKDTLLRNGDVLVIKELDRLGRNYTDIKDEWHDLLKRGIEIVVLEMPILNTDNKSSLEKKLISDIVFQLLAYMGEKERLKNHQRQAEGIRIALDNGIKFGRRTVQRPPNWSEVIRNLNDKNITAVDAQKQLNLKPTTFYKLLKEDNK